MTTTHHNSTARKGFTLLELIFALSITATLAASLFMSMRVGFRARSGAEASLEPTRTMDLAWEFLRGDLQNAIPPGGVLAGSFVGTDGRDDRGHDADDLTFYSTAEGAQHASGNGEIKRVELTISQNGSDYALVRRVTRNLLSQIVPDPDEEVICRGVTGFNARYFDGSEWLDTWDSSQQDNAMPTAIEVTLELDRPASGMSATALRRVQIISLTCGTTAGDDTSNFGDTP